MDFHVEFVSAKDSSLSSLESCKEYLKIALCSLPEDKVEFEADLECYLLDFLSISDLKSIVADWDINHPELSNKLRQAFRTVKSKRLKRQWGNDRHASR